MPILGTVASGYNVSVTPTVESIVIAGGGGGATSKDGAEGNSGASGGGGAGGLVYTSSVSITPGTSYSVVVGAGGSGGANRSTLPTNGVNSSFNSITASGEMSRT